MLSLKILLPFIVFAEKLKVSRIIIETSEGSFGIFPHRRDCVAAVTPGILTYQSEEEGLVYVAVDRGVMVKMGATVLVSVRNALGGATLEELRNAVDTQFLSRNEQETALQSIMMKMESSFISQLARLKND